MSIPVETECGDLIMRIEEMIGAYGEGMKGLDHADSGDDYSL